MRQEGKEKPAGTVLHGQEKIFCPGYINVSAGIIILIVLFVCVIVIKGIVIVVVIIAAS